MRFFRLIFLLLFFVPFQITGKKCCVEYLYTWKNIKHNENQIKNIIKAHKKLNQSEWVEGGVENSSKIRFKFQFFKRIFLKSKFPTIPEIVSEFLNQILMVYVSFLPEKDENVTHMKSHCIFPIISLIFRDKND